MIGMFLWGSGAMLLRKKWHWAAGMGSPAQIGLRRMSSFSFWGNGLVPQVSDSISAAATQSEVAMINVLFRNFQRGYIDTMRQFRSKPVACFSPSGNINLSSSATDFGRDFGLPKVMIPRSATRWIGFFHLSSVLSFRAVVCRSFPAPETSDYMGYFPFWTPFLMISATSDSIVEFCVRKILSNWDQFIDGRKAVRYNLSRVFIEECKDSENFANKLEEPIIKRSNINKKHDNQT